MKPEITKYKKSCTFVNLPMLLEWIERKKPVYMQTKNGWQFCSYKMVVQMPLKTIIKKLKRQLLCEAVLK